MVFFGKSTIVLGVKGLKGRRQAVMSWYNDPVRTVQHVVTSWYNDPLKTI